MTRPSAPIWTRLHRPVSLLLTVVWVGAGVTKLVGLENFRSVLETHGVLSAEAIRLSVALPIAEVALGLGLFFAGARPVKVIPLRVLAGASTLLQLAFCVYILSVTPEAFRTAGCGCGGVWGLPEMSPSRGAVIAVDVALALMSMGLMRVPIDATSAKSATGA